ncbi:3-keto-disaccharide hydrolase [Flavobacteriaceae bacterium LMO-SS05]
MKAIIFLLVFTMAFTACKQVKNEPTQTETEAMNAEETEPAPEWVSLFDGTSFDNWRGYLNEGMYPEWTIEDGAMVFTPDKKSKPGSGSGKNIITKKSYTNFILSLEWKISEGGNSGIFWSVFEDPKFNEAYQTGPEIQVLDNAKHPDSFVPGGTHKAGSLYDMIACDPELVKPAGEWNLCVLEINHNTNQGKVSFNGQEAFTFPVQGEVWDAMIANSKFKGWEGFGMHHTGHIGLQDHGFQVSFRNIKIIEL